MNIYYNQRAEERSHYEVPIMYSRKEGKNCYSAIMVNCSDKGICMMTDYPYLPDSLLNVKTVHDDDMLPVKVVWNHLEHDEISGVPYYKIGARFTN